MCAEHTDKDVSDSEHLIEKPLYINTDRER